MSRTVVVTGSGSGIGAALTALLRGRGDTVVGVDIKGGDITADLSNPAGRDAAIAAIKEATGGRIDALVTCAGTSVPSQLMITLNFFGSVRLIQGLRDALAATDNPRVVMIGSIAGTQPVDPKSVAACLAEDEEAALARADVLVERGAGYSLYPSSKSSVAQWARKTCVAPGWAEAGIALNVVAPGVVLTPMTDGLFDDPAMKAVMDEAVPMPLNSYAPPEALAEVIAFLASKENTHVTGQVVYVDGGAEASLRPADHF